MANDRIKPTPKGARRIALLSAAACGVAATAGFGMAAFASETAADADALVVVNDGTTFYTPLGVSATWDAWVAEFAGLLPPNFRLPAEPTAFFLAEDDERQLFEDGLPQAILSRFARCAWLDVTLDSSSSVTGVAEATAQLARYADYPGVADGLDVAKYEREIGEAAREFGVSPEEWEHEIECASSEDQKGAQR